MIDLTLDCCSPGAARSSEVSGAGQWQSLYLLLSGRKVRALLLKRNWMFNADASREARTFSRRRTAKPQKNRLGLDATVTQRHQFQDGREENHAMA